VITPRRTRLVRVPDLRAFRKTIVHLCLRSLPDDTRSVAAVVPTRAAGAQLALAAGLETLTRSRRPLLVTREQLYDQLHARLMDAPRRLGDPEREALAQAAAAEAAVVVPGLSFRLRPGLVVEMLAFYDQLRRQSQKINRFEELMDETLGGDGSAADRGAIRMVRQVRFLAETFRLYEGRVAASGGCDEHLLRERLIRGTLTPALRGVVLTVADWIGDPAGFFVSDFDLLARMPGLEAIDVVATERTLRSGFHERLHRWLPGVEEVDGEAVTGSDSLVTPVIDAQGSVSGQLWLTCRDREEELVAAARRAVLRQRAGRGLSTMAVVYKQPLPYLYLAPETLGAAGIAYQTLDGLPLAAQPAASVVDLALDFVESDFSRTSSVLLLRSPHLRFAHDGCEVTKASIGAFDRHLSQKRYLGDVARLEEVAAGTVPDVAVPALQVALAAARELAPIRDPAPASHQIRRFAAFLSANTRDVVDGDPLSPTECRVRETVFSILEQLAAGHAVHHDPLWGVGELAAAVRRWVASDTFASHAAGDGVQLLDDRAAPYGEFEEVVVVGLVEHEWPERPRRHVFFSPRLLKPFGWPSEAERRSAAEARFLDLLALPSVRVSLSTFTLDNEAIVMRTALLDEVARAGLLLMPMEERTDEPLFLHERIAHEYPDVRGAPERTREWVDIRSRRPPIGHMAFHGLVGRIPEPEAWSVSALETYLGCPFRFFSQHVLRLEEEPEDEAVMDPRRQGAFVHGVFERFFEQWQASGHLAITPENLDVARTMFGVVSEAVLASLPGPEADLERTRLVGSPVAAGLGEAVLRMEAERPMPVVERLLEHRLAGRFVVTTSSEARSIALRGKADRIDLLADGTFRLIDYKLGRPPNRARALQLPIYALCAEQQLNGYRGRRWRLREAVYLAFRGPRRVVPLFSNPADRARALAGAQQRLVDALDAIGRGEFCPTPDDVFRCATCSYSKVCRKDYVGDV